MELGSRKHDILLPDCQLAFKTELHIVQLGLLVLDGVKQNLAIHDVDNLEELSV